MVWIIWYHTKHPDFVNYPFFNTTLFFVSGVFFKTTYSWTSFCRKKFNRMVVPFLFFYLLYYAFLLLINYAKFRQIHTDIASSIWDLFRLYTGNEAFVVNYPLWFLCALLVLQFIVYGLSKCVKSGLLLIAISVTEIIIGVSAIVFSGGLGLGYGLGLISTGAGSIISGKINEKGGGTFVAGWMGAQIGGLTAMFIPVLGPAIGGFVSPIITANIDGKNIDWSNAWAGFSIGLLLGNISGIFSDAAKIVGKDMAFQIVNGFNAFMINLINILVDFFRGRRAND